MANVERLARIIKQEAKLAQFMVVSLRRPMIESCKCTIDVTQTGVAPYSSVRTEVTTKQTGFSGLNLILNVEYYLQSSRSQDRDRKT
jgi:hypothetical protein